MEGPGVFKEHSKYELTLEENGITVDLTEIMGDKRGKHEVNRVFDIMVKNKMKELKYKEFGL